MRTGNRSVDERIAEILSAAEGRFGAAAVERIAASKLTMFEPWEGAGSGQRPTWLHTPGLAARPFWERDACGRLREVVAALEDAYPTIREEVRALDPTEGTPADLLSTPEATSGWWNFYFYRYHRADDALLARVPSVRAVVERLGRDRVDRSEIQLSVLDPGTHIPPHCGGVNVRLTIHLPLSIPPGDAAIRVHDEVRTWREGEVMIFDDTYEHEAHNRTATRRSVLILTAYHPDLGPEEIEVLRMLEPLNAEVYGAFLQQRKQRAGAEGSATA